MAPTQLNPSTTFPDTQISSLFGGLLDVPQSPEEQIFSGTSPISSYFPYFQNMDAASLIGVRNIFYQLVIFPKKWETNWNKYKMLLIITVLISIECIPQQPHLSNQMHAFDDAAATSNYISSSQSVIGNPYTQPTNNVSNDDLMLFINLVKGLRLNDMTSANHPMIGQQTAQNRQKRGKMPPLDYMCHLCFSKEHFISDCPMVSLNMKSLLKFWKYIIQNYEVSFDELCHQCALWKII